MTSDCMLHMTCNGVYDLIVDNSHCALNEACMDVNGVGVCLEGTLFKLRD